MATKIPVPNRPRTEDADYALGGDPNWIGQFGAGAQQTGDLAAQQGRAFASDAAYQERQIQNRAAPTTDYGASTNSLAQGQRAGAQQGDVYSGLMNFAQGPQGPSGAQAMLQQGANQGMAQNLALARSGSGFGESANNIANAQRANASTMATTSNQAAMLKAQEDQGFRQQQLQAFGQGGDIAGQQRQAALGEAGLQGGQSEFQTTSALNAEAQRDAAAQGWFGAGVGAYGQGVEQNLAGQGLNLEGQNAALQGRVAQGQTEADLYGTEAGVYDSRLKRDAQQREARRSDRGEIGKAVGSVAGAVAGMLSDERSKQNIKLRDARERNRDLSETTELSGEDEDAFRRWAKANNIRDVDHADSHYDYRGFWKEQGGPSIRGGVDHFPDTFKQHGHPTFSSESQYARGAGDGGAWLGEDFVPTATMVPSPEYPKLSDERSKERIRLRERHRDLY